jgi:hypothetical protein
MMPVTTPGESDPSTRDIGGRAADDGAVAGPAVAGRGAAGRGAAGRGVVSPAGDGLDRDADGRDRDAAGLGHDFAGLDRDAAERDGNADGRDRTADVRDRDAAGRPRNARPRDGLGRPLPPGAPGIPTTPDDLSLTPAEALAEAQRLLDEGMPFHAHEVLEASWKAAAEPERELWRGLAQLAVGLTHVRRGNDVGAPRLLRRAADRIEDYADRPPHGIAVADLATWARRLADRVEDVGSADLPPAESVPRLTG